MRAGLQDHALIEITNEIRDGRAAQLDGDAPLAQTPKQDKRKLEMRVTVSVRSSGNRELLSRAGVSGG